MKVNERTLIEDSDTKPLLNRSHDMSINKQIERLRLSFETLEAQ